MSEDDRLAEIRVRLVDCYYIQDDTFGAAPADVHFLLGIIDRQAKALKNQRVVPLSDYDAHEWITIIPPHQTGEVMEVRDARGPEQPLQNDCIRKGLSRRL